MNASDGVADLRNQIERDVIAVVDRERGPNEDEKV